MFARFALLLAYLIVNVQLSSAHAETKITVQSQIISNLDLDDETKTDFGAFRFVGGLVLRSSDINFGGISALHVSKNGKVTAISDTGLWISGKVDRDELGRPSSFSNAILTPMLNSNGEQFENKWLADAEGLAVGKDKVYVSMEQNSRILWFPLTQDIFSRPSRLLAGTEFTKSLRSNFALEAIATPPPQTKARFDLVAISEFSPNENGNARAFFRQSGEWKEFEIPLLDRYLITDAAFTPSGNLLILERRFSLATGARARIRQIPGNTIAASSIVNGNVVLDLNQNQMIDNMEGISVFQTPDGKTKLALISDNNLFPLQRTLYLEFEWLDN